MRTRSENRDRLLARRGIADPGILQAMHEVPREALPSA